MTDYENKNEECIALFCKTLAELNTISLKQMEGYLATMLYSVDKRRVLQERTKHEGDSQSA